MERSQLTFKPNDGLFGIAPLLLFLGQYYTALSGDVAGGGSEHTSRQLNLFQLALVRFSFDCLCPFC